MRVYWRFPNGQGGSIWTVVQTDTQGNNDSVYVIALCQCLLLNLNESPFFATSGIPAQQSVVQQVFPDYYVTLTQQAYSGYFASLVIVKQKSTTPTYQVNVTTHQGVKFVTLVKTGVGGGITILSTSTGNPIVTQLGQDIIVQQP